MKKLIAMILGFLLPPKITGKSYIRQRLKKVGIDKSIVSDECLIELVKMAVGSAKSYNIRDKHFHTEFINFLNAHISIILAYINNPNKFSNDYEDGFYKKIFERHNVSTKKTFEDIIENSRQMILRLEKSYKPMLLITLNDSKDIQMLEWLKEVSKEINEAEILLKQEDFFNAGQFKYMLQLNQELLAGVHGFEYGKAHAKERLNTDYD